MNKNYLSLIGSIVIEISFFIKFIARVLSLLFECKKISKKKRLIDFLFMTIKMQ